VLLTAAPELRQLDASKKKSKKKIKKNSGQEMNRRGL